MRLVGLEQIKNEFNAIAKTIYFDKAHFLREKASDEKAVRIFLEKVERVLQENDRKLEELYFVYGVFGNLYRVIGHPKKAIHYLQQALCLAERENDDSRKVVFLIRLGEALKYNEEHEKALKTFDKATDLSDTLQVRKYNDFIFQHKGKCLLELGHLLEAEKCFLEALHIRKEKGDPELVASTELAIELVKKSK